jgi:hypothetical protein
MHAVQSELWCMNLIILLILIHKSYLTNVPLAFLFIYNLTKH